MREILFSGKRKDNGEWVQSCLVSVEASHIKKQIERFIASQNHIFHLK